MAAGGSDSRHCPYLKRLEGYCLYPVEGYCCGYRDGRLRIPSIQEFQDLCTTYLYVTCRTYRTRVEQEAEGTPYAA